MLKPVPLGKPFIDIDGRLRNGGAWGIQDERGRIIMEGNMAEIKKECERVNELIKKPQSRG
jgi:hypothetical protein